MAASREDAEELAKRLDQQLDDYIDKLPRTKYKDGLSEENWREEIEQIPAFMTTAPTEDEIANNPTLAALQAIKHEETAPPEEKAANFKEDGNDYFKKKKYKQAIIAYTEGIKQKCSDVKLNAILFTNRAAAQFYIGNYRSSLNDVKEAKKLKPDHLKALIRGAECCMKLSNFEEAMTWCDEALKVSPSEKKVLDIRAKADKEKRTAERDKRKQKVAEKKEKAKQEALIAAIKARKITLASPPVPEDPDAEPSTQDPLSLSSIEGSVPTGHKVYLDDSGVLHWPVLFMYPEYGQTDMINDFNENDRFIDHVNVMFGGDSVAPWDEERTYKPENLEIYFEEMDKRVLHSVSMNATLAETLSDPRYLVVAGNPHFILLVSQTQFRDEYLKKFTN
ncbi:tetratricopeptide repeat protein 4-like [Ptychodera flava]|uniref:tetratricopeptide repeat protein 4-like n=1 Tax=Ptychodera flava TaxID=63121 RepID=UPI00396A7C86